MHERGFEPETTGPEPGEVTRLLDTWKAGDTRAADGLLGLVYGELRRLAAGYLKRERQGHTLQPTALVNEAYMRLLGSGLASATLNHRRHFFAIAAKAMRRVLVDHARRHRAEKRIGEHQLVSLDQGPVLAADPDLDVLAVHEALDQLQEINPRQAEVVEMRFFGGFSEEEVAEALEISKATVARDWQVGRLTLRRKLASGPAR